MMYGEIKATKANIKGEQNEIWKLSAEKNKEIKFRYKEYEISDRFSVVFTNI